MMMKSPSSPFRSHFVVLAALWVFGCIVPRVHALPTTAIAGVTPGASLADKIKQQLALRYPGARIEFRSALMLPQGVNPSDLSGQQELLSVRLMSDDSQGQAQLSVQTASETHLVRVSFSAWVPAWIAKRRILPGERVDSQDLMKQEVNVAQGIAREQRGLIVSADIELGAVEARQTLLEGQYLVASAIQRVPELKRGDVVRVRMNSGAITLLTQATAVESGYIGKPVRVLTQKSKRDLIGKLGADGVVEVSF